MALSKLAEKSSNCKQTERVCLRGAWRTTSKEQAKILEPSFDQSAADMTFSKIKREKC